MKLGILIFLISMQAFADLQLWKKYKDKLFTPELIAQGSDCNVSLMDYDEIDNVNGQDCANTDGNHFSVAQPDRISDLSKHRRERTDIPGVEATWEVGRSLKGKNPPRCAVIWCHGAVQSTHPHHLGARDSNFGGNNNRLANLALQQNCLYYSPKFTGKNGYYAVQELINYLRNEGVDEVFISGSSAGANALNIVANNSSNTDIVAGLFYTGTYTSPESISHSPAFKAGVPIIFSQGANDKYANIRDSFFKVQDKFSPAKYPNNMWMQVFKNGGHGTPIRMTDWRHNLNWARAQNNQRKKGVDILALSNMGVDCNSKQFKKGVDGFLKDMKNISTRMIKTLSEKSVRCKEFRKGGKYALPLTKELKKTRGCWPLIRDSKGNIVASINQINCIGKRAENYPGNYRYSSKKLEIRGPRANEELRVRPNCDRQAKR